MNKFALTAAVLALWAAAAATAGPGNGYQAPRQAAQVRLPTVVVVAQRQQAVAVNAGQLKQVNLAR